MQLFLVIHVSQCAAKIRARGRGRENGPMDTTSWCVVEDTLTLGNPCTSRSQNISSSDQVCQLVPRHREGEGERAPGFYCLHMCLIFTDYDAINIAATCSAQFYILGYKDNCLGRQWQELTHLPEGIEQCGLKLTRTVHQLVHQCDKFMTSPVYVHE